MNREIKFRAWDKEENEMDYVNEQSYMGNGPPLNEVFNDGCIWLQYTGLKDKNGKEIYENDILEFDEYAFGDDQYKIVKFNNYRWIIAGNYAMSTFSDSYYEIKNKSKAIGNIYENPELLQGGE